MGQDRIERDAMGEVTVPAGAYFGAETQRAVDNFPISSWRFPRRFIEALGLIKWAAAKANQELGLLPAHIAEAIAEAADEVAGGKLDDHFVVDVFQTGSGTSTNMNANEVIANRANEILGAGLGAIHPVHPKDHVNRCQSSNDVIPTATHLAALAAIRQELLPALEHLEQALKSKAEEFDGILKSGRTHLMDATPVRLGQEFAGFASQVTHSIARVRSALPHLSELALGGTAVGTGLNAHPRFAERAIEYLTERTGFDLIEAPDHFEAQGARDAVVEASGVFRAVAVSVSRIANDLRWLASGPATGIAELKLPALQPGSSIMPGKVNPVIPEAVIQVAAQVIGNDVTIALGGLGGIFELNTMMPVMAYDLLFSIQSLASAAEILAAKCVEGIEADAERTRKLLSANLATVTVLVPVIGYDEAARISRLASESGKGIRTVLLEEGMMTADEIDRVLDLEAMTRPGVNRGSAGPG
jgi:fumarate hydratase class II